MESKNFEWLQKGTFAMLDLWLYNFARNIPDLLEGKSVSLLSVFKDENSRKSHQSKNSAIVIGAGPSVYEKNQLEILANSNYQGTILCTDRMLIPCLKKGITPEKFSQFYVITIDPYMGTEKFYNNELVRKHHKGITTILSTCTVRETVDVCKKNSQNIFWFHPLIDDFRRIESINKIMNMMTKSDINPKGFSGLQTGGNVGTCCWVFSWAILGKSPTALIGINFGYLGETRIEDTPHYEELLKVLGNDEREIKKRYKKILNPYLNCDVLIDPTFDYYREAFLDLVQRPPSWTKTINATEGGSLFGDKIENMTFSNFLEKHLK